eukprot:2396076-Rhodomonas_salina.2
MSAVPNAHWSGVLGLGSRVWGRGSRVYGLGSRVWGLGVRFEISRTRRFESFDRIPAPPYSGQQTRDPRP